MDYEAKLEALRPTSINIGGIDLIPIDLAIKTIREAFTEKPEPVKIVPFEQYVGDDEPPDSAKGEADELGTLEWLYGACSEIEVALDCLTRRQGSRPAYADNALKKIREKSPTYLAARQPSAEPGAMRELLEWMTEESEELLSVYSWKDGTTAGNCKEQAARRKWIAKARAALAQDAPLADDGKE